MILPKSSEIHSPLAINLKSITNFKLKINIYTNTDKRLKIHRDNISTGKFNRYDTTHHNY